MELNTIIMSVFCHSNNKGSFPLQSDLLFFMGTHTPVWTVCLHMSFLVFIGGTFSCFLQQLRCWVHFIARNVTNYLALQKCSQCVHSGSFWTQCGFSSLSRMPVHSRHCCEAGTAGSIHLHHFWEPECSQGSAHGDHSRPCLVSVACLWRPPWTQLLRQGAWSHPTPISAALCPHVGQTCLPAWQ